MKRINLVTLVQQYGIKAVKAQAMTCDEMIAEITRLGGAEYLTGELQRCPECSTLPCSIVASARAKYNKGEVKSKKEEGMRKVNDPMAEIKRLLALQEAGDLVTEDSSVSREIISSEELELSGAPSVPVGNNIVGYPVANASKMESLPDSPYKYMEMTFVWKRDPETKKSKKVWLLNALRDYEYGPLFPINSPMYNHIKNGDIKVCVISNRDQDNKLKRGMKYAAFKMFSEGVQELGYICVCPDFKRTEIRIYYGTPEMLAAFFNITIEKLYKSLDKLHKWMKLVDSPSKITVEDDRDVRFIYHDQAPNEYGSDKKDGLGWYNGDINIIAKRTQRNLWYGFAQFAQMRSYKDIGILAKCNLCANKKRFRIEAKHIKEAYGVSPNQYDLILNQHAVKFDNIGLVPGQIYTVPLNKMIRIVNMRLKMGSSTLGAQEVAAESMAAMRFINEEHGLLDHAHRIKAIAKGLPYAVLDAAKGYEKLDTNQFLQLGMLINRKYGWRMPKLYNIHNQRMSMLETEWRRTISSVSVNTRSAYCYTDDLCDKAMVEWHDKYGEWVSFAAIDKHMEYNSKGEVITIKYPLHSAPCIASHKVLRKDIFNPESPVVWGVEGGIGFSTLYMRTVHGLDEDGDKVAIFRSEATIPVKINIPKVSKKINANLGDLFGVDMIDKLPDASKPVVAVMTFEESCQYIRDMAEDAAAETAGIGGKDLAVRYALTWLHLNGVELTSEMSSLIGSMREGNIKGGVKGAEGLKGIEVDAGIDTKTSMAAGTLAQDTVNWMSKISDAQIPQLSGHGELNPDNLAEIVHALAVKGAKCTSNKHSDKFLYRMLTLLPAYMAHPGNKDNVPWHNAYTIMADGIKPEYLEFDLNDHIILQARYKAVWDFSINSFKHWGAWDNAELIKKELGYSFDLEHVQGFADWMRNYYQVNRNSILDDFRGVRDRETGETLRPGDWDSERRGRRFQRLNRAIRFMLHGMRPHDADVASLPYPVIPEPIKNRYTWLGSNNDDTLGFLKFANAYIGSVDINGRGKQGNSGELCRLFPAMAQTRVAQMYYFNTTVGKKEEVNPFLVPVRFEVTYDCPLRQDNRYTVELTANGKLFLSKPCLMEELSVKFDMEWMERALLWLEKNPYGDEFVYPENDYEGYEEDSIVEEYSEYDSVD